MATQSYATSDMQSLNSVQVQQRVPLQVTTGQQVTGGQKTVTITASQAQSLYSGQKTLTLSNQSQSAQTFNHTTQKTVPIPSQATILQPSQGYSGQQFIVTISGDGTNSENMQEVEIQQGTPSQVIYQAGHTQNNYSEYNPVYNPITGTYYHTSGGSQMAQIGGIPGQIVQGGTYLVSSAMDSEGQHITHTTRASPATVQWLIDNYETAEGVSLPRSTLYNHYLRHCQEQKIDPMNPASFGKLIRSVFLGLRTRRLGTRGNSKYHYYGIKLLPDSPLNFVEDVPEPVYNHTYQSNQVHEARRFKTVGGSADGKESGGASAETTQQYQHQQFLGDASGAIPAFGCVEIKQEQLPDGITIEHVRIFEDLFKKQCEQILGAVVNLQFSEVEKIWQTFWRTTPPELRQNADIMAEQRLSKEKLYIMCKLPAVKEFVKRSDYSYYQALVEVLIPDVLRPIPSSLTQAVRNFAKTLENWLKGAMVGVPEDMIKSKVTSVCAFAQTLRRYTSLNHLAQAARAVLQNTTQINQMLTDLNRVDFANVQEQASWVCQCEDGLVQQIQEDFKKTLQGQNSLEAWALWLEGVVNQVLAPHEGGPNFAKAARQFLLKWSFYSSMVIRDLTLRSAASFGSFHLIRLLYDEYMFYLVEHKVAAATDESPIAVMGEVRYQTMENHIITTDPETKLQLHAAINNISRPGTVVYTNNIQTTSATVHATSVAATPTLAQVGSLNNQGASTSGLHGYKFATVSSVQNTTGSTAKTGSNLSSIQGGQPATVAVVASGSGGTGPKTIVVVPVSASATGSGDAQPAIKRLKVE